MKIADSVIVIEASDPPHKHAMQNSIYVYVPDVDAAYERALCAGAVSVQEPSDKPYGERNCGVRDSNGNAWWIATTTESPQRA